MDNNKKRELWGKYHVIVQQGGWSENSTCNVKSCKNNQQYMVFVGEGARLSTVFCTCCAEHLPQVIDEACAERIKNVEQRIADAEDRELQEAEKTINELKKKQEKRIHEKLSEQPVDKT